jgi:phosphoglucomutase
MNLENDIRPALDSMILSASGWRGVFAADGDEQSNTEEISCARRIIAASATHCFAGFLRSEKGEGGPLVFVGSDTRPTGKAIARAVISALLCAGCTVKWAGFSAIPEIMAWTAKTGAEEAASTGRDIGFVYISASHNPIGHNGLKFGLTDGGVLSPEKNAVLTAQFLSFLE